MSKKQYFVHKIQKGKLLKYAEPATIQHFMNCRLHNKPRKALVGLWLVFYEDEEYVYWGEPRFWIIFSNCRVVNKFYKTSKAEVLNLYPDYKKDFLSIKIKNRVLEEIKKFEGLKDGIQLQNLTLNKALKISYQADCFVIEANCQISYISAPYIQEEGQEKEIRTTVQHYIVHLQRADLSLTHIKKP